MAKKAPDQLDLIGRPSKTSADTYAVLCCLGTLQQAYEDVRSNFENNPIVLPPLETAQGRRIEGLLRELSKDLDARTYQPCATIQPDGAKDLLEGGNKEWLRDQVVQFALKILLDRFFAPESPCDPQPEPAIKWIAATIDKGLTRAHAVEIEGSLDSRQKEQLLDRLGQCVKDLDVLTLLKKILASLPRGHGAEGAPIHPMLTNVAFHGIDQMLEQAKVLGCPEGTAHVECVRFGRGIMILVDPDPHYDWLLPAVKQRLHDELATLKLNIDPTRSQSVDLARGEKLVFLGFELRYGASKDGLRRAYYQRVQKRQPTKVKKTPVEPELGRKRPRRMIALPNLRSSLGGRWVYVLLVGALLLSSVGLWFVHRPGDSELLRSESFVRPSGDRVSYVIYVPRTYNAANRYPLFVFLDVSSNRETDGGKQRFPGISRAIELGSERGEPLDFVVLFPAGNQGRWSVGSDNSRLVIELVDETCKRFSIDPDRIYLTGLAGNGAAVWNFAAEYPDRWAAIVTLTAFRGSVPASRVAHIPCWCFHRDSDSIENARATMKQLEDAGGRPRFTEVPLGATVWNQAYLNKELYKWLGQQRRKSRG
jgi:hypothetical protein